MPARSAAMTAMTAATLDQLSGGRMLLGIGSSGPQVAEGWHGQRFAHQLQRTREYVAGRPDGARAPDGRVPRRDARPAAARRPRQGAEAHDRARPGPDPDLPRGDRPAQHRAGRARSPTAGCRSSSRPSTCPELRGLLEEGAARAGRTPRGLRHRRLGERDGHRRRRRAHATRCGRSSRCTSAGWARAIEELLQPARRPLRLRGRGARDPGPLPGGQPRRRDGRDPRRAHRPRHARGAGRRRPGPAARLPRRRRRDRCRVAPDGPGTPEEALEQLRLVAELVDP